MSMAPVCRACERVRMPPIEGPCPHCGGFYRVVQPKRARREFDGDEMPTAESAEALLRRHGNDPSLALRPTGLLGVDHIFGGGLPAAGTILLSAKEGTGKTSFLWELFLTLAAQRVRALYVSLEQGKKQLVQQFARFGQARIAQAGRHLKIDSQKDLPEVLDSLEHGRPQVAAIDSVHWVQGIRDDHGQPIKSGTANAVERVARDIKTLSDELGLLVFLVGHMNNDGTMSGGHALRHAVDATLGLHRMTAHLRDPRRFLRFETKTRFGEMGREALFKMTENGFKDCGPILDSADEQEDQRPTRRGPVN